MKNIHGNASAYFWKKMTAGLLTAVFVLQPLATLAAEGEAVTETPILETETEMVEASEPIIELKPNNPTAIQRGEAQVQRYVEQANRELNGPYTGEVRTYKKPTN